MNGMLLHEASNEASNEAINEANDETSDKTGNMQQKKLNNKSEARC
jgi:hypothetical protein